MQEDKLLNEALQGDLLRWLRDEGRSTEGVEVIAAVPLLSAGDAAEYGVVLWRDGLGQAHVWTAWQFHDLWDAEKALRVLEARASDYELVARLSRAFIKLCREEGL